MFVTSGSPVLLPISRQRSLLTTAPLNEQWSDRLDRGLRISTLYPEYAVVANAAASFLRNNEDTWAIWLFGSRARGTARTESDWDVALITSSYFHEKRMGIDHVPTLPCGRSDIEINCVRLPIDIFIEHRLAFPHIAWAVAGEGLPLAQRQWRLPIHQLNEVFSMDFVEYLRHLAQTRDRIRGTSSYFETLADPESVDLWDAMCDRLQDETQRMAEGFIKAGCIQRGYERFPKVHDFQELAESVRKELGDEDFASTILALNGNSASDNLVRYGLSQDPTSVTGAIDRLCNLCAALPPEFHLHAVAFRRANENEALSDLYDLARSTAREMSRAHTTLSEIHQVTDIPDAVNETTAMRVRRAWEGVDEVRRAMSIAARDLEDQIPD